MANSTENRVLIRACLLLGLASYLATMNGVDCGRVGYARRVLVGEEAPAPVVPAISDVMQDGANAVPPPVVAVSDVMQDGANASPPPVVAVSDGMQDGAKAAPPPVVAVSDVAPAPAVAVSDVMQDEDKAALVPAVAVLPVIQNGVAIFDVMQYGAKADGINDDALAFIQAWKAACDSTVTAKVVINGHFMVGEVVFAGPCTNPGTITIEILGTVTASSDPSSYSHSAWIMLQHAQNVEVTGGGTINAHGQDFWEYGSPDSPLPVSFVFEGVGNCKMYNLHFVDSMGFHTKVTDSHDVNVYNLTITAPGTSPNTDGIHLSNATNVNITDCIIGTGDDCISIGQGSNNVFISRITCGPGHGISIGSLGKRKDETDVAGITVRNCTLIGTTNGARIKTYHDSPVLTASRIVYQDLVMDRVKNPIIIDQHYNSKKKPVQSSVKISDVHFINIRGTTVSPIPVDLECSTKFPCENIELADIDIAPVGAIGLTSACASAHTILRGIQNPPGPAVCV